MVKTTAAGLIRLVLLSAAGVPGLAERPSAVVWPATVQPFFLSALSNALTEKEADYIARFPVAVINHKQTLANLRVLFHSM